MKAEGRSQNAVNQITEFLPSAFILLPFLPPPIIPGMTRGAAFQREAESENGLHQKPDVFARSVELQLSARRHKGMFVQDHEALAFFTRGFLEPFAQFDFLAGEQLFIEADNFTEHHRVAENK